MCANRGIRQLIFTHNFLQFLHFESVFLIHPQMLVDSADFNLQFITDKNLLNQQATVGGLVTQI